LETIHQHNVVAERHGLLSELRAEIDSGKLAPRQTTLDEWLGTAAAAPRRSS
jgi:GTP cyclohydrolase IV